MSRFDYIKYDDKATNDQEAFKRLTTEVESLIDFRISCVRSKSLALTKLEEVYMWICKGIRNDQIKRNGSALIIKTSKGFLFEKVEKDSWRDLVTGITWKDKEEGSFNHREAVEKFGDSLPTIKEFKTAEEHGFREVLPNIDRWFWSSSVYRNVTVFAWLFNGVSGVVGYYDRNYNFSVRCVAR